MQGSSCAGFQLCRDPAVPGFACPRLVPAVSPERTFPILGASPGSGASRALRSAGSSADGAVQLCRAGPDRCAGPGQMCPGRPPPWAELRCPRFAVTRVGTVPLQGDRNSLSRVGAGLGDRETSGMGTLGFGFLVSPQKGHLGELKHPNPSQTPSAGPQPALSLPATPVSLQCPHARLGVPSPLPWELPVPGALGPIPALIKSVLCAPARLLPAELSAFPIFTPLFSPGNSR